MCFIKKIRLHMRLALATSFVGSLSPRYISIVEYCKIFGGFDFGLKRETYFRQLDLLKKEVFFMLYGNTK